MVPLAVMIVILV